MISLIVFFALGMIADRALEWFEENCDKRKLARLERKLMLVKAALPRLGRMFPETKHETDQILHVLADGKPIKEQK